MELRNRTRNDRWERNKRHTCFVSAPQSYSWSKRDLVATHNRPVSQSRKNENYKLSILSLLILSHLSRAILERNFHPADMLYLFSSGLAQAMRHCHRIVSCFY